MVPRLPRLLLVPLLILLMLLPTGNAARAQLGETTCPELVAWAREHQVQAERDTSLGWAGLAPREVVMLTGLFLAPVTTATFGKPALEWGREDLRTLDARLQACGEDEAMRPHRTALAAAQRLVAEQASPFLAHREDVLAELPLRLDQLAQHPFAPSMAAFLTALANVATQPGWQAAQAVAGALPETARPTAHRLLQLVPYLLPGDLPRLLLPVLDRQQAQRQAEAQPVRRMAPPASESGAGGDASVADTAPISTLPDARLVLRRAGLGGDEVTLERVATP